MKKITRKILMTIAVVVMAMVCFVFSASAATTDDGLAYYTFKSEIVIKGYEGPETDVVIPDYIEGMPVVEITDYAFQDRTDLTSVVLPSELRKIGFSAFNGCSGLTGELKIPAKVEIIGNYAFSSCKGLTGDLIIPESVKSIGYNAFNYCSGFNGKLVLPEGLTIIDTYTFYGCGFTGDLVIPEGVTRIGQSAFGNCSGFTGQLVLPESLTEIKSNAFYNCSSLTGSLVLPEGVTSIGTYAFSNCKGFTGDLVIPEGVTAIANSAFSNCKGFTGNLVIPEGVTSIGVQAFYGCNFASPVVLPKSIESIGDLAFFDTSMHICYAGTQDEWNSVEVVATGNLKDVHCEFNPETDITEAITASTCLLEGTKATVCSCGYVYKTETLPLADCSFTAYTSDNNATCLEDGTKTAFCDYGCGESDTTTDEGSVLGHELGEFIVTKQPTCTVNGEEKADCSRCDYFETKAVAPINHKDENLDGYCENCEEYIADENCLCICHAKTVGAFVYKLFRLLDKFLDTDLVSKVFKIDDMCVCGIKH